MKLTPSSLIARVLAACLLIQGAVHAAERPNVLFVITDDESWLERSAYGWSKLPTPNFDRVAQSGVLLTNGFASAPSCAPSRASVLTGRNFWELKQGAFIQAWLPKEFPVFPELLAKNGYLVARSGKGWGPGIYPEGAHGPEMAGAAITGAKVSKPAPGISPHDYAGNFEAFLKKRKPGQPFFFWAGMNEPHQPWDKENHSRLEKEYGVTIEQVSIPGFVQDTPAMRRKRANFLYEVCYADKQLGRMLASLEAIGELNNTLIIVTADNGTSIDQGKATPYDWGVHVPLAIMWPSNVPAQRTVTDFVNFADIAPTILETSGIEVPASMTGRSFLSVLKSKQSGRIDPQRNFIVTGLEWHGEADPASKSSRTIRNDQFAYIVRYDNVDANGKLLDNQQAVTPSRVELYNLVNDPWQQKDLSNNPEFAEQKQRLADQLRQLGLQTNDPRVTGEMEIFRQTRQFVQERKRGNYKDKTAPTL